MICIDIICNETLVIVRSALHSFIHTYINNALESRGEGNRGQLPPLIFENVRFAQANVFRRVTFYHDNTLFQL